MPTREDLKMYQALPLKLKVLMTKQRINAWVEHFGEQNVYVSFSGGKDSTVLLHLVRQMYPDIEAVFVNTGLEYPEIQQFVKSFDNVTILRPKMRFDEVIKKYGYPFISKEVSQAIKEAKTSMKRGSNSVKLQKMLGGLFNKDGSRSIFDHSKYKPLLYVDFNISDMCCKVMKKTPVHDFAKASGKMPITAQLASESFLRRQQWLKNGCNGFEMKRPISNPMSFWTEQDILQYIKQNDLPIASVYGDIVFMGQHGNIYDSMLCLDDCKLCTTGCKRTGCIFCGFSAQMDTRGGGESRFERLKRTHPRQYEYCMEGGAYDTDGLWKPTKEGLGMKHCIDVLNSIYGDGFIKY